jgi:hypothetical protein
MPDMSENQKGYCCIFQHLLLFSGLRLANGLQGYVSGAFEAKRNGRANIPLGEFPDKVCSFKRDKP